MRLKQIGSNQTEIIFNDGTHVFFSYETPVCVSTVDGLFVTENKYSNTTTKHINKWGRGFNHVNTVPQSDIENIINSNGEKR